MTNQNEEIKQEEKKKGFWNLFKNKKEQKIKEVKQEEIKTKEPILEKENIPKPKVEGLPSYSLLILSLTIFLTIAGFEFREERIEDGIFFIFLGLTLSSRWLYFKYLNLLGKLVVVISAVSTVAVFIIILFRDTVTLT